MNEQTKESKMSKMVDIVIGNDMVMVTGKSPNGFYGMWHIKRYTRIFPLEPIMRKRKLTNTEVRKVYQSL
jgi:hypothetical protein